MPFTFIGSPREASETTGNPVWSFEVRVVHGGDEVHSVIRKSVQKGRPEKPAPLETMTNGVWAISIKSILESEQDFLVKVNLVSSTPISFDSGPQSNEKYKHLCSHACKF